MLIVTEPADDYLCIHTGYTDRISVKSINDFNNELMRENNTYNCTKIISVRYRGRDGRFKFIDNEDITPIEKQLALELCETFTWFTGFILIRLRNMTVNEAKNGFISRFGSHNYGEDSCAYCSCLHLDTYMDEKMVKFKASENDEVINVRILIFDTESG